MQSAAGKGVSARLRGQELRVGSLRFLEGNQVDISKGQSKTTQLQNQGKTVIGVALDGELIGLIAIADTVKADAKDSIAGLKALGLEPVMITGDNPQTAKAVAAEVGIDEVMAQVLPHEKAQAVRRLQEQGYRVAMVGDGINDAPALMQADVGFAIGAGTDIAIESADVILVGERLGAIIDAFHIGKNSYKKTVQNLALAFSFNGIGVPAATTGLVHPVWAMIAMAASVSTVLLNSFGGRLLPTTKPKSKKKREEVTLRVPSIHCEGCLNTIRSALKQKIGDVEIEADLEKHLLKVAFYKEAVTQSGVEEALTEIGFKPEH